MKKGMLRPKGAGGWKKKTGRPREKKIPGEGGSGLIQTTSSRRNIVKPKLVLFKETSFATVAVEKLTSLLWLVRKGGECEK